MRSRRSSATGGRPGRPACRRRRRRGRSALLHDLDERGQDRAGREHGRRDADPSRALPRCFAIRCESASPCSGVNHARTRAPSTSAGRGSTSPVPSTSPRVPELLERERVRVRDLRRLDRDDDVLLPRPRVVRPVRRARPDRLAVADDELVVHEVGDAGDPARLDRERLDRLGCRLGRRRNRDRAGVGDVVEEPHRDAALDGAEERGEDERAGVRLEADVVEGEVERRAGLRQEVGDPRATSAGRCPPSVSVVSSSGTGPGAGRAAARRHPGPRAAAARSASDDERVG